MTKIQFITNLGPFSVLLDEVRAPITCKNFLTYVENGDYNGVIFHRVIKNFMIQTGTFLPNMSEKPCRSSIVNEANNGLLNEKYTLAMARTGDPHSAAAQFFINTNNNGFLNHTAETPQGWGYAVFGKVIDGFNVMEALQSIPTDKSGPHENVPIVPLQILRASVVAPPKPLNLPTI